MEARQAFERLRGVCGGDEVPKLTAGCMDIGLPEDLEGGSDPDGLDGCGQAAPGRNGTSNLREDPFHALVDLSRVVRQDIGQTTVCGIGQEPGGKGTKISQSFQC
ncbi:hypothetical protein ACIPWL_30045 [Streptomyces sp. NPDC090023]|uniref:hypothetical protein n=1 Tax=unclassified Streptomyces TaxID=2593676 RepID=UPI0037FAB723